MKQLLAIIPAVAFVGFAVWKFMASEWSSTWRTRRSGPSNNWKNEGYMANQDGKSWSDIDSTATSTPKRPSGPGTWN
jgi:hypothetical protein